MPGTSDSEVSSFFYCLVFLLVFQSHYGFFCAQKSVQKALYSAKILYFAILC